MDRNIRAFLAVARKGNLTAASEDMGLTQPAVTKTIRRLEAELGGALFDRTARGMFLNEAGRRFLKRAEVIENHYRFAIEEVSGEAKGEKPDLRIVAGVAYLPEMTARLARQLYQEFPRTQLHFRNDFFERTLPELMAGTVDLILGSLVGEVPEGIVARPLTNVAVHVFAGPQNPLFDKPRVSLHDIATQPWVIFQKDQQSESRLSKIFYDLRLPPPNIRLAAQNLETCLLLAQQTDALFAAVYPVTPLAHRLGLQTLPIERPLWGFESGIWLRDSSMDYPIVRRAVELLEEEFAPSSRSKQVGSP